MDFESNFNTVERIVVNKKPIESLDQYLLSIRKLAEQWASSNLWFRGVSKAHYPLIPGIYRESLWEYDKSDARTLMDEFIRHAKAFDEVKNKNYTRWEWYQIMQHHGMPTRLLDWTSASLAALYFSLRNFNPKSSPCVWVLNPYKLNNISADSEVVFYTDLSIQKSEDKITSLYLDHDNQLPELPIAIDPAQINPRLKAQKGSFTVHGTNINGFNKIVEIAKSSLIAKLHLNINSIKVIRDDLLMAGVHESSLFPDLDGLTREVIYDRIGKYRS